MSEKEDSEGGRIRRKKEDVYGRGKLRDRERRKRAREERKR